MGCYGKSDIFRTQKVAQDIRIARHPKSETKKSISPLRVVEHVPQKGKDTFSIGPIFRFSRWFQGNEKTAATLGLDIWV